MTRKFDRAWASLRSACSSWAMAVGAGILTCTSPPLARDRGETRPLGIFPRRTVCPDSARDIECQEFADSCDPGNPTTICFVRIEPRDFDLLALQAHFRKNEDTCPENFSHTYQMGLPVGPNFKINEEHSGGTD